MHQGEMEQAELVTPPTRALLSMGGHGRNRLCKAFLEWIKVQLELVLFESSYFYTFPRTPNCYDRWFTSKSIWSNLRDQTRCRTLNISH